MMLSHASLLQWCLCVPLAACLHHDALRLRLQLLAPHSDEVTQGMTSRSCLAVAETAAPLSLLQVGAEGKRSRSVGKANVRAVTPNRTAAQGSAAAL
eukprot:CAMPEP_0175782476 /NCGR_PEP_ID=MMETSP0097-20121207/77801_1 /TAXON_ID=311494 /ORGANISM="Alexandrium monilatum, Strain CCMP3105" /LENGTH=96 /DNA_ID=CAMNT_0017093295 /DNA_START=90 /DNA_END=377 /DNA_ORIENTATION=-